MAALGLLPATPDPVWSRSRADLRLVSRTPDFQSVDGATLTRAALDVLAVPEIAFLLLTGGLLGMLCWAAQPAHRGAAVIGAAALLAGTTGMWALPAGTGAALLLGFAAASLLLEVLAYPGFGLHAIGGFVSLALAGLLLHGPWSGAHPAVVIPAAAGAAGLVHLAARRSWRRTRADPFAASDVLVGRETVILDAAGSHGLAVVCGQIWQVTTRHGPLRPGQVVRVVRPDAGTLLVDPH